MERIDNKYIETAIDNLISSIGIKEYVDERELVALLSSKKIKECIKKVAEYMGLPIEINLSYVSNEYKAHNTNNFQSTHLVKTNWRGRGSEGITAQVSIPQYLPMYGSSRLVNFPISVRISKNCVDNAKSFIGIMAHELSHIFLHTLWHKEKDNEIYTDLTAMLMGFSTVMKNGRKVTKTTENYYSKEVQTTTYGYLSDEQFHFAYIKIIKTLEKYGEKKKEFIKIVKDLDSLLDKKEKLLTSFNKYFEYVDKHHSQKMPQKDTIRIIGFHQSGYTDEFQSVLRIARNEIKQCLGFIEGLNHYSDVQLERMKQHENKAYRLSDSFITKCGVFESDINVLKRYIPFIFKLPAFLGIS